MALIPPASSGYPTSIDDFATVSALTLRSATSLSKFVTELGKAVEQLETKVGINSSVDASSLDRQMEVHAHTAGADDGGLVAYASLSGVPATFAPASHAYGSHSAIPSTFAPSDHTGEVHTFLGSAMTKVGSSNLANDNEQLLTWTATEYDEGGYADLGSERFVVPIEGYHRVEARISWSSNSNGRRKGILQMNGADIDKDNRTAVTGAPTMVHVWWDGWADVGDVFRIFGYQNSGGSLGYDEPVCYFSIHHLGV